jgi:hypothetical protein
MTDLILKRLRMEHAALEYRAEHLRTQQRAAIATSPRAAALGRQIRETQAHADSYAVLIEKAEEMR